MSSATIHRMQAADPLQATINRTVRALQAARDMTPAQFCEATAMTKGTYYNRMRGDAEWTAAEVKRAADVLGVDVATLFDGLQLPHLDSNQKPADYQTGTVVRLDDHRRTADERVSA